jgi:hypothetical protein
MKGVVFGMEKYDNLALSILTWLCSPLFFIVGFKYLGWKFGVGLVTVVLYLTIDEIRIQRSVNNGK